MTTIENKKGDLELRMYGFVPYNISATQVGIQFGHAIDELYVDHWDTNPIYREFAKYWKTYIILSGGTSNNIGDYYNPESNYRGTMETIFDSLTENGIECAKFHEPDLNNMLSGIAFIVDERVFNRKKYPNFEDLDFASTMDYHEWVEWIGGEKNLFLRTFLPKYPLAKN